MRISDWSSDVCSSDLLHGSKIQGRYALIQTGGKNWLAHRMKEQPVATPEDLAPMLATHGSVEKLTPAVWAFEGKWDGRSEERRVGKECVSTCRSRWSPYH